ncbi:Fic family protein [Variovorax sp. J22G21]|uniref:Fic family protein n=1 Tax=Variovorax fucosicus TaxID=3053517 RepID=UPI0025773CE7|nr:MULTISPECIES: Fic family protein [unclassified Variovorax]MDM0039901.1 Fic family protein [Variovorax sp. J22R193]MDM0064550.1 Fic family protein [Variovorax sp. J22G21]
MASHAPHYIWQQPDWPQLHFDFAAAGPALLRARELKGQANGMARAIGLESMDAIAQELWMQEAVATAAIEGETLDLAAVRSSVLRHLGADDRGPHLRHVDGLVEVIQDATLNFREPLDTDRLCRWQSALFPGGTAGIRRIAVGRFRDHADAMQIVSGALGKEVVHYTAPASADVPREMEAFLQWFAATTPLPGRPAAMDGIARAAIAHVWFETIHPFEDGNGRIGRAVSDMALAQDSGAPTRLYSLSRQVLVERRGYYDALAQAQRGGVDVTAFVQWFADVFGRACVAAGEVIQASLERSRFWATQAQGAAINERQRKLLQRLLLAGDGGFLGGLNVEKYLKMVDASKATATRDLSDLVQHGLLHTTGQGKALRYYVSVPGWAHGRDEPDHPPFANRRR